LQGGRTQVGGPFFLLPQFEPGVATANYGANLCVKHGFGVSRRSTLESGPPPGDWRLRGCGSPTETAQGKPRFATGCVTPARGNLGWPRGVARPSTRVSRTLPPPRRPSPPKTRVVYSAHCTSGRETSLKESQVSSEPVNKLRWTHDGARAAGPAPEPTARRGVAGARTPIYLLPPTSSIRCATTPIPAY
jgi:hypothetical protein